MDRIPTTDAVDSKVDADWYSVLGTFVSSSVKRRLSDWDMAPLARNRN